jgi:hypothetical protein
MAASRIPGPMCQFRNPEDIDDGTLCRRVSPSPGVLGTEPDEQIACPEAGLEDDEVTEFVVFLFADAAMAAVKGIEKLGFKELISSLTRKEEENITKAVDYFDPVTKTYPNSPYLENTTNPREIAEKINNTIANNLKKAVGSDRIAEENLEIERLHDEYIRTGKWTFDGLDDWQLPDKGLQELRREFELKQLNK